MSPEVIDLIKTVFGTLTVLGGAGGIGTVVYKRRPSKNTSLAQEVAENKTEMAEMRQEMRLLTDYVHDLREHIALGKAPPPPDWPEGLRL